MNTILSNLINDRAKDSWGPQEINAGNFHFWQAHWFNTAEEIQKEFDQLGLIETSREITKIIAINKRFAK